MQRIYLFLLAIVFLIAFAFPGRVLAQENELLKAGEIIESDYIRAGNTIQIDGEIKGDAFLLGGLVTINGKIDGDLFVLGGKVNVNGQVGNSLRIMGGDVTVNGPIGRNTLLVCGNCSVTRLATISGSFLTAGGNLEVAAPKIGKGFRFFGNRLFLNSEVANEAFVVADKEFLLGPGASISGNLKYTGNTEAILETGATVGGSISYQKNTQDDSYPRFFGARTVFDFYKKIKPLTELAGFFVSALVGFVLLGLFPKGFEKTVRAIENRPYASLGWGLVVAVSAPAMAILFALTIVGIPVTAALFIIYYVLFLISQYLAAFFVGRKILLSKFGERRGWALVLGLFLFYLLGLVPVIGNLVKMILMILTIGAIALSYKQPEILKLGTESTLSFTGIKRGRGRPRKISK